MGAVNAIPSLRYCKFSPTPLVIVQPLTYHSESFQLIVWLVPSFTATAVRLHNRHTFRSNVSYCHNHTARILPRHLVNGTVRWMAAYGAGRSVLFPFITGAMASNLGIKSLQPWCVFPTRPIPQVASRFTQIFYFRKLLAMMIILDLVGALYLRGTR